MVTLSWAVTEPVPVAVVARALEDGVPLEGVVTAITMCVVPPLAASERTVIGRPVGRIAVSPLGSVTIGAVPARGVPDWLSSRRLPTQAIGDGVWEVRTEPAGPTMLVLLPVEYEGVMVRPKRTLSVSVVDPRWSRSRGDGGQGEGVRGVGGGAPGDGDHHPDQLVAAAANVPVLGAFHPRFRLPLESVPSSVPGVPELSE